MLDLEDEKKFMPTPEKEIHQATFRRRGSDLIFGVTVTDKIQVHRFNHRFKSEKVYLHQLAEIEADLPEIKEYLEKEGYKHYSDHPVTE